MRSRLSFLIFSQRLVFLFLFLTQSVFGTNTGSELRLLLRDIVKSSQSQTKEQQRSLFEEALSAHPVLITEWLKGKSTQEILKEAQLPFDIKFLSALDSYQSKVSQFNFPLLKNFESLTKEQRKSLIHQVPDTVVEASITKIREEIGHYPITELSPVQEVYNLSNLSPDLNLPPSVLKIFKTVLTEYFDNMPLETRQQILIDLLDLPPSATKSQEVAIVLQNSGPVLQKLFQLIGKRTDNPLIQEASEQLLANVRPFPFEEVKQIIETRTGDSLENIFTMIDSKPLAAGTVGQVHRAVLKQSGQKVAVKILRPNLLPQVEREFSIFERKIEPEYLPALAALKEGLLTELDLIHEAGAIQKGKSIYESPAHGLYVAGIASGTQPYQDLLFLEFAEGSPLNKQPKMTKEEKFEQASRFSRFAKNWAYHVFFNGGFAHVDLHSGNIFYDLSQANPKGKQTLLDFGSTITVRPTTARSFIRLLLAAHSNDLNLTLRALRDDMELSPEQELSLKQNLETILKNPELSAQAKAGLILNQVQSQGLPIAKELVHLLRGHLFLDEHIATFNSELDALDPNHSLGRFSLKTIYAHSGLWGFVKDFYRFIIRDPNRTLTPDLVGRIAKEATQDVVQSAKSTFQVFRENHCAGLLGLLTRSTKID